MNIFTRAYSKPAYSCRTEMVWVTSLFHLQKSNYTESKKSITPPTCPLILREQGFSYSHVQPEPQSTHSGAELGTVPPRVPPVHAGTQQHQHVVTPSEVLPRRYLQQGRASHCSTWAGTEPSTDPLLWLRRAHRASWAGARYVIPGLKLNCTQCC